MDPLRRVQHPTQRDDEILDLESSGIFEIEHPICTSRVESSVSVTFIHIDEPHPTPRCPSAERELLRSPFVDL
ncbi:MAG: hypothetical protein WD648_11175 [Planctomycetaceae bacterium]